MIIKKVRLKIKRNNLWEIEEIEEIIKKVKKEIKRINLWRKLKRSNRRDIIYKSILIIKMFTIYKLLLSL